MKLELTNAYSGIYGIWDSDFHKLVVGSLELLEGKVMPDGRLIL